MFGRLPPFRLRISAIFDVLGAAKHANVKVVVVRKQRLARQIAEALDRLFRGFDPASVSEQHRSYVLDDKNALHV